MIKKADFIKLYPTVAAILERENIQLQELNLTGQYQTTMLGFASQGVAPWESLTELRDEMAKFDALNYGMTARPLYLQSMPNESLALATFEMGDMFSSKNLLPTTFPMTEPAKTWSVELVATMLRSLQDIVAGKITPEMIRVRYRNDYMTPVTEGPYRTVIADITSLPGIDDWLALYGSYMGVHARHHRGNAKGRVFITIDDNIESNSMAYTSDSGTNVSNLVTTGAFSQCPMLDGCAPDARMVMWQADRPGLGSTVPDYVTATCQAFELDESLYAWAGVSTAGNNKMRIGVEVPFHDSPVDTMVWSSGHLAAQSLYFPNERYGAPPSTYFKTKYRPEVALLMYPDLANITVRGSQRTLSDFPATGHLSIAPIQFQRFHPVVGGFPEIHCFFFGTQPAEGTIEVAQFGCQIDRDWLLKYQLTGFGLAVKKLAASAIAKDWPDNLPDTFSLFVAEQPLVLTAGMVLDLNLAKQYKKARERACKTDNFLKLVYANGVTYEQAIAKSQSEGGTKFYGFFSSQEAVVPGLRESRRVKTTVVKNGEEYSCTVGSAAPVIVKVAGELATPESKSIALEYVGMAMFSGGAYPTDFATTLEVGADVVSALAEIKRDDRMKDSEVAIVVTPDNLAGATGTPHAITALHRNGFLPVDFISYEQRIEMTLHALLISSLPSKSLYRILQQFRNI